jgi:hypothetical protein
MAMAKKKTETKDIRITAPNYHVLKTTLVGTAPFVSNNFAQEAEDEMREKQEAGQSAKTGGKNREAKDFKKGFLGSLHESEDGWYGIPATAFRAALIRACAVVGVEMTKAKMCVFVEADGYEKGRGTPLVKIVKGKPEQFISPVRNANGSIDLRSRAKFAPGWEVTIRVRYDADLFKQEMIANLINRAGISVGVGAGRPFSTASAGQGWGTFEIKDAVKKSA